MKMICIFLEIKGLDSDKNLKWEERGRNADNPKDSWRGVNVTAGDRKWNGFEIKIINFLASWLRG